MTNVYIHVLFSHARQIVVETIDPCSGHIFERKALRIDLLSANQLVKESHPARKISKDLGMSNYFP